MELSPPIIGMIGLCLLFLLIFLGTYIAFAMALVGFFGLVWFVGFDAALGQLSLISYSNTANYTFVVLPLFLVMGQFASAAGITRDAYDSSYKWLGHLPGGLAMASVGACAAFAAVSGTSMATGATMTQVAWPEMKRYNYDPGLSLGAIASGGTLGILIPPSTVFVLYAIFANESIGQLFLAGVFPGLLLTAMIMLTIYVLVTRNPALGPRGAKASWQERLTALKGMWSIVVLFAIVMGGLWGGIFTPAEAGGVGAFGALVIGLAKRRLTWQALNQTMLDTVRTITFAFFIIIGAMIFSCFLAMSRLPFALSHFVSTLPIPPMGILVSVLMTYLILGAIMEEFSMTVLTLPIFVPILRGLGFDMVWFGVLFVLMAEMACITPPIGVSVFVIYGVAKDVPLYTVFRGILPFLVPIIVCLIIVIAFPQIALFAPSTMMQLR
jgi:tripartite ATP-independent transporter DctM subunit